VGQCEGEVAEHLDVLVLQRREAFEVFVGDLVAGGSEVGDGIVHVLGVPDHEGVEREAERAELVFLAFAVGLAELAAANHRAYGVECGLPADVSNAAAVLIPTSGCTVA